MIRKFATLTAAAALFAAAGAAHAQEAAIRKALAERIPQLPKIDEIRPSQIPGLYEVRYGGSEIIYSDAKGDYLIQGALIETRTMANTGKKCWVTHPLFNRVTKQRHSML